MPGVIDSMCQLFAGDAKIFRSIRSVNNNRILQNDLDKLSEWSERWQEKQTSYLRNERAGVRSSYRGK